MTCRADIRDARSRIEDASDLFRLKSRTARDDFDELSSNWADTRGSRFGNLHIQPQTEMMAIGSAVWRDAAESVSAAEQGAEDAERFLRQAYACEEEFEREREKAVYLLRTAEELAAHATGEAIQLAHGSERLLAAIASTAQDPGW